MQFWTQTWSNFPMYKLSYISGIFHLVGSCTHALNKWWHIASFATFTGYSDKANNIIFSTLTDGIDLYFFTRHAWWGSYGCCCEGGDGLTPSMSYDLIGGCDGTLVRVEGLSSVHPSSCQLLFYHWCWDIKTIMDMINSSCGVIAMLKGNMSTSLMTKGKDFKKQFCNGIEEETINIRVRKLEDSNFKNAK